MLILFFIVGILLFVLGIVIRKYNVTGIIAGYNEEKTKDKQGLTKWVGTNLIIMGILATLISVFGNWFGETVWLIVIFVIVIIIFSIRTARGCKKYEK